MGIPRRLRVKTAAVAAEDEPSSARGSDDAPPVPSPQKPKRKQKKHVLVCTESVVPPARRAYALYLKDQFPKVKAKLPEEQAQGRCQRLVIQAVAQAWNRLTVSEKKQWEDRASNEARERRNALSELCEMGPAKDGGEVETLAEVKIGDWSLGQHGQEVWAGTKVACFAATHDKLGMTGMALVFGDDLDFKNEVRILKTLQQCPSPLYLEVLQPVIENVAMRAIIHENLPTLAAQGRFSGLKLRTCSKQMAMGILHLHAAGFYHLDIRPKSWFWSEERQIAKMGRFTCAREISDTAKLDRAPYCAPYRCPELWDCLDAAALGEPAEAWAFGATVAELSLGSPLFTKVEHVWDFRRKCVQGKMLQVLSDDVRFVVAQFLQVDAANRMSLQLFVDSPAVLQKLA